MKRALVLFTRDLRVRERCERARVRLLSFPGITVVAPGELTPASGDHYRVFTPYWRAWSRSEPPSALRGPGCATTFPPSAPRA